MSAEYRIDVLDTSGALVAQFTDYLALSYSNQVSAPGLLRFNLLDRSPYLSALQTRYIARVFRRNLARNVNWYRDFSGLILGVSRQFTDHEVIEVICPGALWLLNTRIVDWYKGVESRSQFTAVPVETILKTLVDYNAGPNATTVNGRILRNGAISGVTIEADSAAGLVLNWACDFDVLLETMQKAALSGGGDFDLVPNGAGYIFTYYPGQKGTDRTATVRFALGYGNMGEPVYSYNRVDEKTVAIVGGQGEGITRRFRLRTSAQAASSDAEMLVDANDVPENADADSMLDDRGDAELQKTVAQQTYDYKVLQTSGYYYGRDYFVGDLVTGQLWFNGLTITQKIIGVEVGFDNTGSQENIDVQMQTVGITCARP